MDSESDDDVVIMYWYWRRIRRRRRRQARSQWVSDFLMQRQELGAFQNMVREIRESDLDRYINFTRMTPETFNYLLNKIGPLIQKNDTRRDVIAPDLRLSLTLRYLASGDSMVSLHYLYRVSKSSISYIISETCQALWDALASDVIQMPSVREWECIAEEFGNRWDFPNCVGAIDGKHVIVQCFNKTGSQFYNYKGSFSIVLMGVCDADYRFTYVSIGSAGRESDGGVFENTAFGRSMNDGTLNLPDPKLLPGSNVVAPHVFVGDNAFPLKENLLRPFPGQDLHASKVIFNYRLSRARRLIENTFGILANKFRIYRKPIIASLSTVEKIVKATVVLHNFLRTADLHLAPRQRQYIQPGMVDIESRDGIIEPGSWRADGNADGLRRVPATTARHPSMRATEVRDSYTQYFMTYGQVPFQWRKLPTREREFYSQ